MSAETMWAVAGWLNNFFAETDKINCHSQSDYELNMADFPANYIP